ncbi:type IX secretion system sortase PorU [Lewinella sp. IMCC34191]|uniref:type IX secretion system sortase PorU n=1 Tax=Lewinella sp. IMCC34191 TaxID=2259172 RepID=UPI000E2714D2|nr:type IX secretion system sortase PorU [Lewinella sp. IMCC34191]
MPKLFPAFICLLLSGAIGAQITVRQQLTWEEPTVVEWEGNRRVVLSYIVGDDESALRTGKLPPFIHTLRPADGRSYSVEVVELESESFLPPSGFESPGDTDFTFSYSSVLQPEGWSGKISGPSIIATTGGLQRLTSVSLRLVPGPGKVNPKSLNFTTQSVLREGDIYKIAVQTTGVYRLSRAFLTDALKVSGLDAIDPRDIKIYGQRGGMLPETVNATPPDDLSELAIHIEGEGDGSFDGGDYILFYAEGPDRQTYDPVGDRFSLEKNIYSTENHYYLQLNASGRGRRVGTLPTAAGGTVTTAYDDVQHYEEDQANILHVLSKTTNSHGSGQSWWGDFFEGSREKSYPTFVFPDLVTEEPVGVRARMAVRAEASSRFFVSVNGTEIASNLASAVIFGAQEQSPAARPTTLSGSVNAASDRLDVRVLYPRIGGGGRSEAWLDYVQLRGRRRLSFGGRKQFAFRDTRTIDAASVTFDLLNPPAGVRVWRVDGPDVWQAGLSGNRFNAPAGALYEYVAFQDNTGLEPRALGKVANQNIHAINRADMIIVTHPEFKSQAENLAQHRRDHNGFTVQLVTTEEIYNEFSSGRDDPAAIRNFVRMVYERDPGLKYLLLFGDGSFDHRNIYKLGTNFIPVFEHDGSLTEVNSFPADDFYGIMTPAFGSQPLAPDLSIAVGRLPLKSADEANPLVDKLIRYDTDPSTFGDWRTRMVFVGDDEDRGRHTIDVNRVANAVESRKPDLNFDKLYFDLYPQQSISAGERYPAITEGLDRAVFRGAMAVTYLGHGGPRGWAQERVLTIPQIRNWTRPESSPDPIQPPVFITATCTFSNYDDASFVSAGEEALLTPNGGVIALMTTTRPVFATRNYQLTNNTVQAMLDRSDGEWPSLGDIIRIAKNATTPVDDVNYLQGDTENARKYTLLGDPATVLALPRHSVRTTMIDTLPVDMSRSDTVRALQKVRISGEVITVDSVLLSNFNGEVYPTIYDKEQTISTLQQNSDSPLLEIDVQRNIIFRGRATVTDGKFSFEFVVPNDIDYSFGPAKVSYYAADKSQRTDAAGFYDRLIVGGTGDDTAANDEGPTVEVYLDDTDFVTGGEVSSDPVLLLHLTDDLGINVTGNSIGHDLEAVLDEDSRNPIVLNDYYEADVDNYRSGKVRYPLFDLEPGLHTVRIRAWDVANNSTVSSTEFIVASDMGDALTHVLNYPNPFTTSTCFQFDHTLVGQEVSALIQIYTVSGRLVKTLQADFPVSDGTVRQDDCIEWDGLDDYGDQLARGVYLYQIRLQGDGTNIINGELEKLVILK